jgi:hypothetical protein
MVDHSTNFNNSPHTIFQKFRQGVFYEDLYKEHEISEEDLISILQRNIKGNYDYKRVLNGGLDAQKQFIAHLNTRWNPLDPNKQNKEISPYLPEKVSVENSELRGDTKK